MIGFHADTIKIIRLLEAAVFRLIRNCFLNAAQFREICFCVGLIDYNFAPARTFGKYRTRGFCNLEEVLAPY